jgi:hypothetical protein
MPRRPFPLKDKIPTKAIALLTRRTAFSDPAQNALTDSCLTSAWVFLQPIDHRLQPGAAIGGEARQLRENVLPCQGGDLPGAPVKLAHFGFQHGKRRPGLFVLWILQRDQQTLAASRKSRLQFTHVATTKVRRECDQRRAVVQLRAADQRVLAEVEGVTADQFDITGTIVSTVASIMHFWRKPVLDKELRDGQRRQLHTQHAMALRRQPREIPRLVGQYSTSSGSGCSLWKQIRPSRQRFCQNSGPWKSS